MTNPYAPEPNQPEHHPASADETGRARGWYPDEAMPSLERYHDGDRWTSKLRHPRHFKGGGTFLIAAIACQALALVLGLIYAIDMANASLYDTAATEPLAFAALLSVAAFFLALFGIYRAVEQVNALYEER